eukprot:5849171-Alexandrium_andersonii.AAC.1
MCCDSAEPSPGPFCGSFRADSESGHDIGIRDLRKHEHAKQRILGGAGGGDEELPGHPPQRAI